MEEYTASIVRVKKWAVSLARKKNATFLPIVEPEEEGSKSLRMIYEILREFSWITNDEDKWSGTFTLLLLKFFKTSESLFLFPNYEVSKNYWIT
jgi:hypothetical protein